MSLLMRRHKEYLSAEENYKKEYAAKVEAEKAAKLEADTPPAVVEQPVTEAAVSEPEPVAESIAPEPESEAVVVPVKKK
jgi:hypothetical protein